MSTQTRWLRSFIELYLEVEAGLRPARHLRPFMALDLQADVGNCGRLGPTPTIVRIRSQRHGVVCEAVALLAVGEHVSALAVALRRQDHGWRVTEIRRPDSPPPPEPSSPAVPAVAAGICADDPHARTTGPRWTVPDGWSRPARAA